MRAVLCSWSWYYCVLHWLNTLICISAISGNVSISVEKSRHSLSSSSPPLVHIAVPIDHPRFRLFIAKVADVSLLSDETEHHRDINRTFSAAHNGQSTIDVYDLHPGHRYHIAVFGRLGDESELLSETQLLIEPVVPDFGVDANSSILVETNNVTLRAVKPFKALQDAYRVEYWQTEPLLRRYPVLDIHDIVEQSMIEIYLGNLQPGHEHNVTISSVKEHVQSQTWSRLFITKPLAIENVTVEEINGTCLRLNWTLPPLSGADGFNLTIYNYHHQAKQITLPPKQSTELCDFEPGRSYEMTIGAVRGSVQGVNGHVRHTMRPLTPVELRLETDIDKALFILSASLSNDSLTDHCQFTVISEQMMNTLDQTVAVDHDPIRQNHCSIPIQLQPGIRYELSVRAVSNGSFSHKLSKSLVLQPAFDVDKFGLHLEETGDTLSVLWPREESEEGIRLLRLWPTLVGNDSQLHIRVSEQFSSSSTNVRGLVIPRQFDVRPLQAVKIHPLRRGACYKVQIYTVTQSGIVSAERFEELVRTSTPNVDLVVENVSSSQAMLRVRTSTSSNNNEEIGNGECQLNVVVVDMQGMVVFDRMLSLELLSPIALTGLRPFHRYTTKVMVSCGKQQQFNSSTGIHSSTVSSNCATKQRPLAHSHFETRQDRPGPVANLSVTPLNPYSALVSWSPPALPNGIIAHYMITVVPMERNEHHHSWTLNAAARSSGINEAVVDELVGGESYRFEVRAVTEAGLGDPQPVSDTPLLKMPILAPPRPASPPEVFSSSTFSSTSIIVRFSTASFSHKHGHITKVAVLVEQVALSSSDQHDNHQQQQQPCNSTIVTWRQVQEMSPYWSMYTAIEETKMIEEQPRTIEQSIGTGIDCANGPMSAICNGPLRPASAYRLRLRLFTRPDLCTDSPRSAVIITAQQTSNGLLSGLFGTLLLIVFTGILVASLVFVLSRRRKRLGAGRSSNSWNNFSKHQSNVNNPGKEQKWRALKMMMAERAADCLAKLGIDSDPTSSTSTAAHHRRSRSLRERTGVDQRLERLPSGPFTHRQTLHTLLPGCNTDKNRPVKVEDFAEHLLLMSADSDFRFSEEYEELKSVGTGQSCQAAELSFNRAKNRFTNVLPYDHSRVKLKEVDAEDGSDYINASYIPGFNSKREFIAAQGPLPSTRDDFWRVVWEQQCPQVVALTRCVEKGRDKCHRYWPDAEERSVIYADIEVTLMNETSADEFLIRELRLTNLREAGSKCRTLRHFHYTAWPDFGVPDQPAGLVHFVRIFRRHLPPSRHNKPTVVHCSAGVGRTGTFIAVDQLLQAIDGGQTIDIFGFVREMRMERGYMVQNEQQYIFIHQCALVATQPLETTAWSSSRSSPPRVHQNPAFDENELDEGIAESGL